MEGIKKTQNLSGNELDRRTLIKGMVATVILFATRNLEAVYNKTKEKFAEDIRKETEKATSIMESGHYERILESPYLVSAFYYSDAYWSRIASIEEARDSCRIIVDNLKRFITPESREHFMQVLKSMVESKNINIESETLPLPFSEIKLVKGKNHPDALDLFVNENKDGPSVFSMTEGVVVLAENGWSKDKPLSTSSYRGGNTVIIFSSFRNEFYRYCHLKETTVAPGEIVHTEENIGQVGHTGLDASKPGHGGHLHLEINRYNFLKKSMQAVLSKELEAKIRHLHS